MAEHAKLSPSGAEYWMVCPGAPRVIESAPKLPDEEYSAEGTKAHALGARALELKCSAAEAAQDFELEIEFGQYEQKPINDVQIYVDAVNSNGEPTLEWIEKRLSIEWLSPGSWGTADNVRYYEDQRLLVITDYKNGVQGVDAEWNRQMMQYGLGAANEVLLACGRNATDMHKYIETVRLVVVQPNDFYSPEPVKVFEISMQQLLIWGHNVLVPAASRCKDPNAPLVAGSHCHWCDGKITCPELQATALALAGMNSLTESAELPAPESVSPARLAMLSQLLPVMNKWAKQVNHVMQEQALQGTSIPGHKLVKPKGCKVFKDGIDIELEMLGVEAYTAPEPKHVSPNQAINQLKDQGYTQSEARDAIEGLWYDANANAQPVLVHESDRRKAVEAPNLRSMFDDDIYG